MEGDDSDLCGDETIRVTDSCGESLSGVTDRVKNKPGVTKIGQTVLIGNVNRYRPYAYMHRHKLHRNPPGLTVMGNIEVNNIMEGLNPIIKVEGRDRNKIFKERHIMPLTTTSVGERYTVVISILQFDTTSVKRYWETFDRKLFKEYLLRFS